MLRFWQVTCKTCDLHLDIFGGNELPSRRSAVSEWHFVWSYSFSTTTSRKYGWISYSRGSVLTLLLTEVLITSASVLSLLINGENGWKAVGDIAFIFAGVSLIDWLKACNCDCEWNSAITIESSNGRSLIEVELREPNYKQRAVVKGVTWCGLTMSTVFFCISFNSYLKRALRKHNVGPC